MADFLAAFIAASTWSKLFCTISQVDSFTPNNKKGRGENAPTFLIHRFPTSASTSVVKSIKRWRL